MSRDISSETIAAVDAQHSMPVALVSLGFSTPIYAHTGIGTITYDGNDYLGVGDLVSINAIRESDQLAPSRIEIVMTGISSDYIIEALNAGNYGDTITIYQGYRADDGTLVGTPEVVWRGQYEYGSIETDDEGTRVSITGQHDLGVLTEKRGRRYTDESQEALYPGDSGFLSVAQIVNQRLYWGGGRVNNGAGGGSTPPTPPPGGVLP